MLQSLRIDGFRKYKSFCLQGLNTVNFILGPNNIGKTSVLEAVFAWACGMNVAPILNIPVSRGRYSQYANPYWLMEEILSTVSNRGELPLKMSFMGLDDGETVEFTHTIFPTEILSEYDTRYKKIVDEYMHANETMDRVQQQTNAFIQISNPMVVARWRVDNLSKHKELLVTSPFTHVATERPYKLAKFIDLLSHTFVNEVVQVYSILKRENLLDEVVKEMRRIYPDISGFDMIPYPDGSQAPISVVKYDGSVLPIYAYGDGVQRWFYIIGSIALNKNSILCIDEIDTGIHPAAQPEFLKHVIEYAVKSGTQIFATTHNIELIDNLLSPRCNVGREYSGLVSIFTLRNVGGQTKTRALSYDEAQKSRMLFNMELR